LSGASDDAIESYSALWADFTASAARSRETAADLSGTNARLPSRMIFLLRFEKAIDFGRSW
jgi:hypothetical protein